MTRRDAPGKIVNIASLLSFQAGIRVPAYAASKGGIAQLTKALANEWAPKRINVNANAPGYIATSNTEALQADATRNRQILERFPASRWDSPRTSPEPRSSSAPPPATTSPAPFSPSTAAGWDAEWSCRG